MNPVYCWTNEYMRLQLRGNKLCIYPRGDENTDGRMYTLQDVLLCNNLSSTSASCSSAEGKGNTGNASGTSTTDHRHHHHRHDPLTIKELEISCLYLQSETVRQLTSFLQQQNIGTGDESSTPSSSSSSLPLPLPKLCIEHLAIRSCQVDSPSVLKDLLTKLFGQGQQQQQQQDDRQYHCLRAFEWHNKGTSIEQGHVHAEILSSSYFAKQYLESITLHTNPQHLLVLFPVLKHLKVLKQLSLDGSNLEGGSFSMSMRQQLLRRRRGRQQDNHNDDNNDSIVNVSPTVWALQDYLQQQSSLERLSVKFCHLSDVSVSVIISAFLCPQGRNYHHHHQQQQQPMTPAPSTLKCLELAGNSGSGGNNGSANSANIGSSRVTNSRRQQQQQQQQQQHAIHSLAELVRTSTSLESLDLSYQLKTSRQQQPQAQQQQARQQPLQGQQQLNLSILTQALTIPRSTTMTTTSSSTGSFLKVLRLAGNAITDNDITISIGPMIASKTLLLQNLDLSVNNISMNGLNIIGQSLVTNQSIKCLNLKYNWFTTFPLTWKKVLENNYILEGLEHSCKCKGGSNGRSNGGRINGDEDDDGEVMTMMSSWIPYICRLNQFGRRLIFHPEQDQEEEEYDVEVDDDINLSHTTMMSHEETGHRQLKRRDKGRKSHTIPLGLWPTILQRCHDDEYDVIYYFLQNAPFLWQHRSSTQ